MVGLREVDRAAGLRQPHLHTERLHGKGQQKPGMAYRFVLSLSRDHLIVGTLATWRFGRTPASTYAYGRRLPAGVPAGSEFDQDRVAVYTLLCPSVLSVEAMKIL
jgi:hypothetical protein